nr:MAG: ORF1 [TTV-like mini virus]
MPPFRRTYRWNFYRNRPRRWFWFRRPRTTLRRRRRRAGRRFRVRRRRQKFYRYYKKAKKITVKEFQPETIQRCKVKGYKCLFQCGEGRVSNNYAQFMYSYTPEHTPGGGGWSMMVFSLASMYEDYQHYENIFTKSNAGLPLVIYKGAKFRFFQHLDVDYIVVPRICYPMTDTPLDHANSQPYRALLEYRKIIIPSVKTKPLKRRSKSKFFRPPAQMRNNWYFQKKIADVPLLMLTTISCSLTSLYINPSWSSNNITITSLNTLLFQNHNFDDPSATSGYKPRENMFLYTTGNGGELKSKNQLIKLANTKDYITGTVINNDSQNKMSNWGNPFHHYYFNPDVRIYQSNKDWNQLSTTEQTFKTEIQLLSQPLYVKLRYNPDKDTGEGNKAYFVKNYHDSGWDQPENLKAYIEGFPLYILFWGWIDWIKKLRPIDRVDTNHIIVIKSPFFDGNLQYIVPIDKAFLDGEGIYGTEKTTQDIQHWHPQTKFQQSTINTICECGPGVAKPSYKTSFEAHTKYCFYLKWGGCPKTLEKIYDPSLQQDYPIPSNQLQTIQITDPRQKPEYETQTFDYRRDIITTTAAERIKKDSDSDSDISSIETGPTSKSCRLPPQKAKLQTLLQKLQETSDSEKEEETPQLQLIRQRNNQRKLKRRILRLLKLTQTIE